MTAENSDSRACGRLKRLVCWMWHRQGHWTEAELQRAHERAVELGKTFGVPDA